MFWRSVKFAPRRHCRHCSSLFGAGDGGGGVVAGGPCFRGCSCRRLCSSSFLVFCRIEWLLPLEVAAADVLSLLLLLLLLLLMLSGIPNPLAASSLYIAQARTKLGWLIIRLLHMRKSGVYMLSIRLLPVRESISIIAIKSKRFLRIN